MLHSSSNNPREYWPSSSQGSHGFPNLYDIQVKKHVKLATKLLHTKTITGDLLEEILLDISSDSSIGMGI